MISLPALSIAKMRGSSPLSFRTQYVLPYRALVVMPLISAIGGCLTRAYGKSLTVSRGDCANTPVVQQKRRKNRKNRRDLISKDTNDTTHVHLFVIRQD